MFCFFCLFGFIILFWFCFVFLVFFFDKIFVSGFSVREKTRTRRNSYSAVAVQFSFNFHFSKGKRLTILVEPRVEKCVVYLIIILFNFHYSLIFIIPTQIRAARLKHPYSSELLIIAFWIFSYEIMTEVRQRKNAQEDENEKLFRETDHVSMFYFHPVLQ